MQTTGGFFRTNSAPDDSDSDDSSNFMKSDSEESKERQ